MTMTVFKVSLCHIFVARETMVVTVKTALEDPLDLRVCVGPRETLVYLAQKVTLDSGLFFLFGLS